MPILKTGKFRRARAAYYRIAARAAALIWAMAPESLRMAYSGAHYPKFNRLARQAALKKIKVQDGPLPPPESPVLVCSLRDEADKIAEFLRHHRALGVKRFVFIDNNSRDGSAEFLGSQPDCDLWLGWEPFSPDMQNAWRLKICDMYTDMGGRDRWFLSMDADELLVWDGCEDMKIDALVRRLARKGIRHARAQMIDMYRAGRALDSNYDAAKTLVENYPYFDADYAEEISLWTGRTAYMRRTGGPRAKLAAPELTKVPLFYFRRGETFDIHVFEQWWLNFSPCHLGLLHFKFLPGAMDKINEAVRGGYHWNGSFEYKALLKAFARDPGLSFMNARSRKYESSLSLVREGIIRRV